MFKLCVCSAFKRGSGPQDEVVHEHRPVVVPTDKKSARLLKEAGDPLGLGKILGPLSVAAVGECFTLQYGWTPCIRFAAFDNLHWLVVQLNTRDKAIKDSLVVA